MALVTSDEVKEIIDVDTTLILTPFIGIAHLIVDENLVDSGYTAARLKEIERWLSAHFVAIRDKRISDEKIGEVAVSYDRAGLGKGLEATTYGQQALMLDSSGLLMQVSGSASLEVFGLEN